MRKKNTSRNEHCILSRNTYGSVQLFGRKHLTQRYPSNTKQDVLRLSVPMINFNQQGNTGGIEKEQTFNQIADTPSFQRINNLR